MGGDEQRPTKPGAPAGTAETVVTPKALPSSSPFVNASVDGWCVCVCVLGEGREKKKDKGGKSEGR